MRAIEDVYRDYLELRAGSSASRTPLEIQTAIEALGLRYESVSGPAFWGRLCGDWLDGTQAGHPFMDNDLNARYCDLAVSRGLLREA